MMNRWQLLRESINDWSMRHNTYLMTEWKPLKDMILTADRYRKAEHMDDYRDMLLELEHPELGEKRELRQEMLQYGSEMLRYALMSYFLLEIVKIAWMGG